MFELDRRSLLVSLASLGATASALAQDGSRDVITFVSAFPAGSGADILVRLWAQRLGPLVGAPIVVVNKPGAMGFIAAEFTAKSKPDGRTIFIHAGHSIAGNMHVFRKPPFDVTKELRVISTLSRHSYMLIVGRDSPHKRLQDLTAAMTAKGEKATYGTSNTSSFLIGELYRRNSGVKAVHVNYRTSADFVTDLNGGSLDYAIVDAIAGLAIARQGTWRLLAIGSAERMASAADVPTFTEGGVPGIDVVSWWGAMAPAATPQPDMDRMRRWFSNAMSAPGMAELLQGNGNDLFVTPPAVAETMLTKSADEWKTYVEIAKIEKI